MDKLDAYGVADRDVLMRVGQQPVVGIPLEHLNHVVVSACHQQIFPVRRNVEVAVVAQHADAAAAYREGEVHDAVATGNRFHRVHIRTAFRQGEFAEVVCLAEANHFCLFGAQGISHFEDEGSDAVATRHKRLHGVRVHAGKSEFLPTKCISLSLTNSVGHIYPYGFDDVQLQHGHAVTTACTLQLALKLALRTSSYHEVEVFIRFALAGSGFEGVGSHFAHFQCERNDAICRIRRRSIHRTFILIRTFLQVIIRDAETVTFVVMTFACTFQRRFFHKIFALILRTRLKYPVRNSAHV